MVGIAKFRNFIVKVGDGSGCLFQPMSEDYSYVLTAKHVVDGHDSIKIEREIFEDDGKISSIELEIIGQPYFNSDKNKDAAIIKIKRVDDLDFLLRIDDPSENLENYYICGYPESRSDNNDGYRQDKLTVSHPKEYGYIEAEIGKFITYKEVVGQSGGGILKYDGSYLLAGIQKKMSEKDENETLSKIDFMPLSFFDEIIEKSQGALTKLYPSYIASFTNLINKIFPLEDIPIEKTRDLIKSELQEVARELCSEFTPERILKKYEDSFVLNDKKLVNSEYLWISFLELLVLNQIHTEDKITLEMLSNLRKKNKLLFGKANKWADLAESIFKADLSEVEKGGCVVVAVLGDPTPTLTEWSKDIIPDICKVSIKGMTIHSTITNPFEELTFKHIYAIHKHIIDNCHSFAKANSIDISDILKKQTHGIFAP